MEDEAEIRYELPAPPAFLPRKQANWGPMTTSSARFAVAALRKSSKISVLRCKSLISTSKEGERLDLALDRISRQVKSDMMLEQVPNPLRKDRRVQVLEDMQTNLEQMSKKRKISVFMENYLLGVLEEKQAQVKELEQELFNLNDDVVAATDEEEFQGTIAPSIFEIATRTNRALPASCSRPIRRPEIAKQPGQADAVRVFLSFSVHLDH